MGRRCAPLQGPKGVCQTLPWSPVPLPMGTRMDGTKAPMGSHLPPSTDAAAITPSPTLETSPLLLQKSGGFRLLKDYMIKVLWDLAAPRGGKGSPTPRIAGGYLSLPLQTPAHTAGAVCGEAAPAWRRIYKYKILINHKNFNSRLSGKEPNIRLPNKPPVFFKANFM